MKLALILWVSHSLVFGFGWVLRHLMESDPAETGPFAYATKGLTDEEPHS